MSDIFNRYSIEKLQNANKFGFVIDSPARLQNELLNLGIIVGNKSALQKYWEFSMALFEHALTTVGDELINEINNKVSVDDNKWSPDEIPKKLEQFRDAVSRTSWTDADITLSPTEFYNKFFANCLNAKNLSGKGGWRNLFEHIGASQQCTTAQKRIEQIIDKDVCYICRLRIEDGYTKGSNGTHSTRECEHILPAFTALGYKGLIQTANINAIPESHLDFFKYEYANAHQCCNQTKTDDKWIKYNQAINKYDIDESTLKNTLKRIIAPESTSWDCNELKVDINKEFGKGNFVNTSAADITATFLIPILEIINADKEDYGDLFDLYIRINQINGLKPNIRDLAYALLMGETPPPPQKITGLKKSNALYLARKQFKDPVTIFFNVFAKLFSKLSNASVEIIFVKILQNDSLRKQVRISRRIFDTVRDDRGISMMTIAIEILKNAQTEIESSYGDDEDLKLEESFLIALNNRFLLQLENIYKSIIFNMFKNLDIEQVQISPEDKDKFNTLVSESNKELDEYNSTLIKEQSQLMQELTPPMVSDSAELEPAALEPAALVPESTTGGYKHKKMLGGNNDNLINSLKQDILKLAYSLNFDPKSFGITDVYNKDENIPYTYTIDDQELSDLQQLDVDEFLEQKNEEIRLLAEQEHERLAERKRPAEEEEIVPDINAPLEYNMDEVPEYNYTGKKPRNRGGKRTIKRKKNIKPKKTIRRKKNNKRKTKKTKNKVKKYTIRKKVYY